MEEQHWVEALFPSHFSMQDLVGGIASEPVLVSEHFAARRAKRIENIYQREMKNFQQEQKLKRKAYISGLIISELAPPAPVKEPKSQGYSHCHTGVCKSDNSNKSAENSIGKMEVQCMWNAEELTVLHETKYRKDIEQHNLKAQQALAHFQAKELKANSKKLVVFLEMKEAELHKVKLELQNRTLYLRHIMQESTKKDSEIQGLKEDLQEEKATTCKLNCQLQQSRLETQDLHLGKEKLVSNWKQLSMQHQLEKVCLVENLKAQSGLELKKLQTELDAVKTELRMEKCQQAENKEALELLCKHFSSLPSSGPAEDFKIEFLTK
ncbi:coiled-coil domain-containing protein 160 [Heterodontus francisci]|uniref:coiled-coil domain-containing protein 160 n=1 Tax=Heterodontus francisci TaxID=7792 RepID=UPI00355B08CD